MNVSSISPQHWGGGSGTYRPTTPTVLPFQPPSHSGSESGDCDEDDAGPVLHENMAYVRGEVLVRSSSLLCGKHTPSLLLLRLTNPVGSVVNQIKFISMSQQKKCITHGKAWGCFNLKVVSLNKIPRRSHCKHETATRSSL